MKIIAWALVLILAAIVCWQYVVNKNDRIAQDSAYKAQKKELNETVADYANYRIRSDSMLNNATAIAVQAGEISEQSRSELNKKQARINELLAVLDAAEKETPDTSWIHVSPNYKWGCDSLRRANIKQGDLINQYEQDNQAHVDALSYETQVRDSALQRERLYNSVFQGQLISCMNALNDAEKAQRKAQLYAGMAAWGNSLTPLGGGEINLGLKTRNDQFFEIKGAYLGKWWVGVGTKFLIHLK
jgi:hypothetical protein